MYTSEGKKIVITDKAPKAIGPYSQAIRTENLVFTAGQIGLDPATMEIVKGGVEAETKQVLTNLKHVLDRGQRRVISQRRPPDQRPARFSCCGDKADKHPALAVDDHFGRDAVLLRQPDPVDLFRE